MTLLQSLHRHANGVCAYPSARWARVNRNANGVRAVERFAASRVCRRSPLGLRLNVTPTACAAGSAARWARV